MGIVFFFVVVAVAVYFFLKKTPVTDYSGVPVKDVEGK